MAVKVATCRGDFLQQKHCLEETEDGSDIVPLLKKPKLLDEDCMLRIRQNHVKYIMYI